MADRAEPDRREAFWIGRVVAHDDHDAFAELVRLHQTAIRQFLRRLTGGDLETADDLAQETFWRAYRHLATFEARGRLLSWLFRIAFQLFVSDRRARRIDAVPLPPDLPAPVDEAQSAIDRRTVDQLMMRLAPDERAAILLHYQYGMSHPEIAETLALPLGTVKTLIRRGRQRLQTTLAGGREGKS
jgi:RNA polymerase sigma-70 factor (ECF subfamily)